MPSSSQGNQSASGATAGSAAAQGSQSASAANAGADGGIPTANLPQIGSQSGSQASQSAGGGQQTSSAGGQEPGQNAGSQSRLPSQDGSGANGRDTATGDLNNGQSGAQGSSGGNIRRPGGNYSLDNLPGRTSSGAGQSDSAANPGQNGAGGQDQSAQNAPGGGSEQNTAVAGTPGGASTTAERAAILDERLRRGYETFDGFILSERERAQNESNAAGSVAIGGADGGGGGGAGGANQPQTMEEAREGTTGGVLAAIGQPSQGQQENTETFPPPDDIPSGRDDDVVARQIREAAMIEPDPELREALWEEYRNYTGIGEEQ